VRLCEHLHEACLVEDAEFAVRIAGSQWRRVLNFIGDYIPCDELERAFEGLRQTAVILIGVGAVGSWVAVELARSGIGHFTLIDDDTIESSNLNRSLYSQENIGQRKVEALAAQIKNIDQSIEVVQYSARLCEAKIGEVTAGAHTLKNIIREKSEVCVVVNSADYPSVDATSAFIDEACQATGTPYVIAGGYNLHLSLVGMTVVPGQSACYQCGRMTLEQAQGNELDDMRKLARPWRNIGNLGPLAAITASFAANEVIRLALPRNRIKPAMLNRRGEFNFLTNQMHFTELPPRPECACGAVGLMKNSMGA
jgi:molybdopterin/thiamine biosynthesis adenylyltransferase